VRPDGQVDVIVGGNALVSGNRAQALAVQGATAFTQATGTAVPPVAGQAVTVVWAAHPTRSAGLDGGRVAGLLSVLAPTNSAGTGGILPEAAARYDALATTLADQVNGLHATAITSGTTKAPGGDFFTFDTTKPAALGLTVRITDPRGVAVAEDGKGALDGSVGDKIAQLAKKDDGPDSTWRSSVVELGVRTASAGSRAKVAESSRATAAAQQLAQASVDTDEETVNMLAYQRAYEGAARVLTAIDQMLDTLINRTGLVGR
jgi:flagellar hook-associated protein 1 FlgK